MITSVTFVVVSGRVPTTEQLTFKKVDCNLWLRLKSKWLSEFVFFVAAGDVVVALMLCLCCVVFECGGFWLKRQVRDGIDIFSVEKQPFYAWLARQHVKEKTSKRRRWNYVATAAFSTT